MSSNIKLAPDLIPRGSFFKNLRAILKPSEWDYIRQATYAKAGHKCEACGDATARVLHCHEVWEYDEASSKQKLVNLVALCPDCHETVHIGLAQVLGRFEQALAHMQKVNGIDRETAETIVEEAFRIWRIRSSRQWTLDVSALDSLKPSAHAPPMSSARA